MKLTRATAQRALDAVEQDPPPSPAKLPTQDSAQAQPPARPRDPNLAFTRVSRIVLQAVTLSAQIAAGAFNRVRAPASADPTQPEPQLQHLFGAINRGLICDGLHRMTETHPDHEALYDTIEDTVEESLAEHPEDPLPTHFARACKILGLTPDLTGFPGHLAEALLPPAGPAPDD